MRTRSNLSKDAGEFVELPTGMCVFSRDNPFPMKPWGCPVCGELVKGQQDDLCVIRYGMCWKDVIWWEDEFKMEQNKTFAERLSKFFKYLEMLRNQVEE